jgi:adenosylcobinamide-phosphate synthase
MEMKISRSLQLVAAYGLDSILGDPEGYPHPVRLMGRAIEYLEGRLRPRDGDAGKEMRAGCRLAATLVGGTWLAARAVRSLPGGEIGETFFLYTSIARRDLNRSALRVAESLERGEIAAARDQLKALAGRDAARLSENEICKAVVESIAENFVDGVLVPLMWGARGGAPGAMAFKAVSTLDSMIGHRDDKYYHFGACSARMDDAAVYPWARLSVPLIAVAALMSGENAVAAFAVAGRDGAKHESPNSGLPEAAFAGALGLKLGGSSSYGGRMRRLPEIGEGTGKVTTAEVRRALRLLDRASLLALGLAVVLATRRKAS